MDVIIDVAEAVEELSRLTKSVAHELDRSVAGHLGGMTVAQWHVLSALQAGRGRAMAELAAVTLLPGPSLTRLIDGMVDDNLVLRKVDVTDRRRVLVYQTRRGASAWQRAQVRLNDSEELGALVARNAQVSRRLAAVLDQLRGQDAATTRS